MSWRNDVAESAFAYFCQDATVDGGTVEVILRSGQTNNTNVPGIESFDASIMVRKADWTPKPGQRIEIDGTKYRVQPGLSESAPTVWRANIQREMPVV